MTSVVLQAAQQFDRDAVGGLAPHQPGVLIIDDAHRSEDLGGLRLLVDDPTWSGWRVIMTLRPGNTESVLERAGLHHDEAAEIAFNGLTRPQATALLEGEPYNIRVPEVQSHLVGMAEGSPLMLHLGAQGAIRGDLSARGQGELLRAHARGLRKSSTTGLHEDLVTLAALFGRFAVTEQLTLIRHLYPAVALPDVREALTDAADAGLDSSTATCSWSCRTRSRRSSSWIGCCGPPALRGCGWQTCPLTVSALPVGRRCSQRSRRP